MKVVVNATPLIALAILERLELLPQLFEEVFVPPVVYQEVVIQGGDRPGSNIAQRGIIIQAPVGASHICNSEFFKPQTSNLKPLYSLTSDL